MKHVTLTTTNAGKELDHVYNSLPLITSLTS